MSRRAATRNNDTVNVIVDVAWNMSCAFNSSISYNGNATEQCWNNTQDSKYNSLNESATSFGKIELPSKPFSKEVGFVFMTCALCLSFVIFVENSLTLYILWITPSLNTIQNKYISSLAYADLMVGSAFIELLIVKQYDGDCSLTIASLHSSINVSMFNLVAIAVDRYVFIAKPFLHMRKFTSRFTKIVIAVQWIVGLSYGAIPTFLFSLGTGKDCHPFFILHHTLITWSHLAHYALNVVVTGTLYGLIARIAKQKTDQRMRANRFVAKTLNTRNNDAGTTENTTKYSKVANGCGKFFRFCRKHESTENDANSKTNGYNNNNDRDRNSSKTSCEDEISRLWNKYDIPLFMIGPEFTALKRKDNNTDEGIGSISSRDSKNSNSILPELGANDTSPVGQLDDISIRCPSPRINPDTETENVQSGNPSQNPDIQLSGQNTNTNIINNDDDDDDDHINNTPSDTSGASTSVVPPKPSCPGSASSEHINKDQPHQDSTLRTSTNATSATSTSTTATASTSTSTTATASISTSTTATPPSTTTPATTVSVSSSSSSSNRTTNTTHSFRWLKQVVLVYGLFVVCWTPSQIAALLYLLGVIGQDAIYVVSWFGVINSALNFYVYAYTNPQFRKALKQRFKRKRCSSL